jgi:hypothetical protein
MATAEKEENATGYRLLKVFKKGLEIDYARYKDAHHRGLLFRQWNWLKVRDDLSKLYESDRELFKRLQEYSERRLYKPGKDRITEPAARPELARFVRTMRDVEFDYA